MKNESKIKIDVWSSPKLAGHPVTMPVRCIVIFLCIITLINGAQAFE